MDSGPQRCRGSPSWVLLTSCCPWLPTAAVPAAATCPALFSLFCGSQICMVAVHHIHAHSTSGGQSAQVAERGGGMDVPRYTQLKSKPENSHSCDVGLVPHTYGGGEGVVDNVVGNMANIHRRLNLPGHVEDVVVGCLVHGCELEHPQDGVLHGDDAVLAVPVPRVAWDAHITTRFGVQLVVHDLEHIADSQVGLRNLAGQLHTRLLADLRVMLHYALDTVE
uniref:UDP-glycosyltransferase 91C1 n=2 Tax=Lygus hesperus TaxID=30085 RepID=A0A0A9Y477_LYGHE